MAHRSEAGPRRRAAPTIELVAYDEELAGRVRTLVGGGAGVDERPMFGGLAFLIDGNLAVSASSQGGLLVRVDPTTSDELLATTPAEAMVMRGRPMTGWLRVPSEHLRTEQQLASWVERGTTVARALPSKAPRAGR